MKIKILSVSILVLSLFSCKVTLVPAYDASFEEQVTKTAKLNDQLYLEIQESSNRSYSAFSARYVAVQTEISSIVMKTMAMDHNTDMLKIAQNLETLFKQFKDDHKTNDTVSDADIKLNQAQIRGVWVPLLVAVRALKDQIR